MKVSKDLWRYAALFFSPRLVWPFYLYWGTFAYFQLYVLLTFIVPFGWAVILGATGGIVGSLVAFFGGGFLFFSSIFKKQYHKTMVLFLQYILVFVGTPSLIPVFDKIFYFFWHWFRHE